MCVLPVPARAKMTTFSRRGVEEVGVLGHLFLTERWRLKSHSSSLLRARTLGSVTTISREAAASVDPSSPWLGGQMRTAS